MAVSDETSQTLTSRFAWPRSVPAQLLSGAVFAIGAWTILVHGNLKDFDGHGNRIVGGGLDAHAVAIAAALVVPTLTIAFAVGTGFASRPRTAEQVGVAATWLSIVAAAGFGSRTDGANLFAATFVLLCVPGAIATLGVVALAGRLRLRLPKDWMAAPDSRRAQWFLRHPMAGISLLTLLIVPPMGLLLLVGGAGLTQVVSVTAVASAAGWVGGYMAWRRQRPTDSEPDPGRAP